MLFGVYIFDFLFFFFMSSAQERDMLIPILEYSKFLWNIIKNITQ